MVIVSRPTRWKITPGAGRHKPWYGGQAGAARFVAANAPSFSMTSNLDEPVAVRESLQPPIIGRFRTSDRALKPVYDSRGQGVIRYSAVSDARISARRSMRMSWLVSQEGAGVRFSTTGAEQLVAFRGNGRKAAMAGFSDAFRRLQTLPAHCVPPVSPVDRLNADLFAFLEF